MKFRKFEEEKPKFGSIIIVRLKDEEIIGWSTDEWKKLPCYVVEVCQANVYGDIMLQEAWGERYMEVFIEDCLDWCYAEEIWNV